MKNITKTIMALGAVLLATALVSAALLTYFGQVQTTATVQQSVAIDGRSWDDPILESFTVYGGCVKTTKHSIENRACVGGTLQFTVTGEDAGLGVDHYVLPEVQTIVLENKVPQPPGTPWPIIQDGRSAELSFTTCKATFDCDVTAMGLESGTDYTLAYYKDVRIPGGDDDWGHIVPIGSFMTDGFGSYSGTIDTAFDSLPYPDDYNAAHAVPDPYDHTIGAKLWIVPTADVSGIQGQTVWNPEDYLFETDLVLYFNGGTIPAWSEALVATFGSDGTLGFPIGPTQTLCMLSFYSFAWNAVGSYAVTSTLEPVST